MFATNWDTFLRRWRNTLRTVFTRGDFSTLIITCLLMVIPVLALNSSLNLTKDVISQTSSTWRVSFSQLVPVAIMSVLFGFLLARSHYSEAFSLILSAIYSIAVIAGVQFFAAPGNPIQRVLAVITRFAQAVNISLESNTLEPYILVLFLSILIWFLGHNTAWHTFRLDRVWRAILPPGIVLALNAFYNVEQTNLDFYIMVYVFLSFLLIIRSHIEAREYDWYMNRVAYQGNLKNLRKWFFRSGALIGLLMLIFAWLAPTGSTEDNAKKFQEFLSGDVMQKISQLMNKLFGSVEGSGLATADYYGGDSLTLGGALQLGDQIVLVVRAPTGPRYYWKSRVFDTYNNNTWRSPRTGDLRSEGNTLTLKYPEMDPATRRNVDQQFTFVSGTSGLLYAAPQPLLFDVPAQADIDYVDQSAGTVNPSVTRQLTRLVEGDSYTVTSSLSVATADYLRTVPAQIPSWVSKLDLQIPNAITARTRQLAFQIVQEAGAATNYDKAKAIEQWLRTNIKYNEAIVNPPAGRDLVDWVLFDAKEGYCTYYASSMVMMLRSLGIPARMAAGFSQGVYDSANNNYIVRERDAHTWVEVWFGPAGWVEFEPTAAQQTTDRSDPNAQASPQVPPTNTPLPTPTFTPSPTPTNTPANGGAVPPSGASPTPPPSDQNKPTATATTQPTNTPSPTFTPTPPVRMPQLPPPVQNTLYAGLILAILIAILSFLAVGLLWWVEYRGLDKIGPIGRAYARLAIYARWLGIPISETSTPLEQGRRIAKEVPEGNRPVTSITDQYINERYAPPRNTSAVEEDRALDEWRNARRAFVIKQIRRFFGRDKK